MLQPNEYYDQDFNPVLSDCKKPHIGVRVTLEKWDFNNNGIPAPTLNGVALSYWLAGRATKFGEIPVLGLEAEISEKKEIFNSTRWMSGIVQLSDVELLLEDEMEFHRKCAGSLYVGPEHVAKVIEAFQGLSPELDIPRPKTVTQFN